MLENRENNQRIGTRSSAAVPKDATVATNAISQVNVSASVKNSADNTRADTATNGRNLVRTENIRPVNSKNIVPPDCIRQTRSALKRAAMDDAPRVPNAAPNPHAKKRPALANLTNNANLPASHVRASVSKITAENQKAAIKSKTRSSAQSRDVETQMAGLSVLQKKGEPSNIRSDASRDLQDSNNHTMADDNDENLPPNSAKVVHSVKPNTDEDMTLTRNSVDSQNLALHPTAIQVPLSENLAWPINQEKNILKCLNESTSFNSVAISRGESLSKINYTDIDIHKDPQMCSMYATDVYRHLHCAELKRRPATHFMEHIQKEINASMRGILVDWLVEVAEEYKLVPDTLYLTISYIDRFLSSNTVNRQRLQLLGVSCMLIAAKYEEICAPQVEEFCYITDNTYCREEVLEMERRVLNNLHFELTTPTTKTFLRRFIRAAQSGFKVTSLQLEFLGNYLAELTLVEYSFLQYLPSMVAASAVFLAKLTLEQDSTPWNTTLQHYTGYRPSELENCVKALFHLQCNTKNCSLPAIREKYRQHKFKCVANLKPPPNLPSQYFLDLES